LAAVVGVLVARTRPADLTHLRRHALFALAAAFLTSAFFHTSFGSNLGGIRDAFAAFGRGWSRLGGETGHEKPWWYYLRLFTGQRAGGLIWEQRVFFALAVGGLGVAVREYWAQLRRGWAGGVEKPPRRSSVLRESVEGAGPLLQGTAVYTVIVAFVLSLTPDKTPWHAVHFVPGFALLAAGALAATARLRTGRLVAVAAVFLTLGSLFQQTWRAAFLRPADARNPYAYVHSSPDVLRFRPLVETALAHLPDQPVRIISEEYWPLPWYLRGLPRIGYWSTAPDDCDGALVVASAVQAEIVKARLRGPYHESILGLRPGFICVVFARD
jgi:hypothetical protein